MSLAVIGLRVILEVVAAALISGVAVIALFACMILGTTRASYARRAGNGPAALRYTALAVVSGAVLVGALAVGLLVLVGNR